MPDREKEHIRRLSGLWVACLSNLEILLSGYSVGPVGLRQPELIRRRAGRDDDFASTEPARVNGVCSRSQEDERDRDRHRKEAGDPGREQIETHFMQGAEVDRDHDCSARDSPTPDRIAQLESNAGSY